MGQYRKASLFALAVVLVGLDASAAGDKPAMPTDVQDKALAERMKREKAARQTCKINICKIARLKRPEGDNVRCTVVRTWTSAELEEFFKDKLNWPFGPAQCTLDVKIDRAGLVKAMTEPEFNARVGKHDVNCQLDDRDGKVKYAISFVVDPEVKFERGKAVKASLHWSKVDGTALAKSALWSASKIDNTFNVFEKSVVDAINGFFTDKCDEVKNEVGG
jgi:hypothetical protein